MPGSDDSSDDSSSSSSSAAAAGGTGSDSDSDFDEEENLASLKSRTKKTKTTSPTKKTKRPANKSTSNGNGYGSSNGRHRNGNARPDGVVSSSSSSSFTANGSRSSGGKRPPPQSVSSSSSSAKKKRKVEKASSSTKSNGKKMKDLDKAERLYRGMQAFLWWEARDPPAGCQWNTMEHAGVAFPDPYEPHHVRMLYDGEPVSLTTPQEEAATFFASMDPEGMHLGNPKTRPTFEKNFFQDFQRILGKKHLIKSFAKCDFTPIRVHLNTQKIIKKAITDEQRKDNKQTKDRVASFFGYCMVDGHLEKVGNYNMEPPGTFRGRGEHPKAGKLKQRVAPEQVSLNLSQCARVPPCPVPGHAWGDLRHDPEVQWLAHWKENINGQGKYMQLAAQSSFKGKSDRAKYNKAALLCANIDKIRKDYKGKLKSKTKETKQLATAMWVIDRLALRVGGEKDTEEEADTVGCCSLRVEHLHFDPNDEGDDNKEIELEFLGKDSMLYKQVIDFGAQMYMENNGMGEQVYKNFKTFCKGKKPSEEVFDDLTPATLNNHLKSIMDGLSAKVFRTYNASKTLQDELLKTEKHGTWSILTPAEKVVEYNNANRQVAILCNHQRSVSKAQETQLENMGGKLRTLKAQKKTLKSLLKLLSAKGGPDGLSKKHVAAFLRTPEKDPEAVQKALARAKRLKETAKNDEDKIAASKADEEAKALRKSTSERRFKEAHLWDGSRVPTMDQLCNRIDKWTAKIAKTELDLKHRDDNKEVSLGTSKLNYMDPRISVAWCKRNEVPIEKVFSKTLRDKFNWAMAVSPDWEFNADIEKG